MSEAVKKFDWANRRRRHVEKMVTTKSLLDVLSDLFAVDRQAMINALNWQTGCNEKIAFMVGHPGYHMTFLGIINCILARHGQPKLEIAYGDDGNPIGFREYKQ